MGGLGFIGSHLCRALIQEGYEVRIFDKLYASRHLVSDIEQRVQIVEGDAERAEDVLESLEGVDVAINLIHTTVPGSSMQDPGHDLLSNVVPCTKWLARLKEMDLTRLIYISSGGTVYGVPIRNPITEDHPTDPICSYGITKLAIEKYIAMYAELSGIEYRIFRPANAYGEGQRLNIGQGVIGVFLHRAVRGETIEIWGDGTNRRDYLYVKDLVDGILKLIDHKGEGRVFNISTGIGHSLNDILRIIREKLNIPTKVEYKTSRKFDVPINILDSTRFRDETGWEPKTDLTEGIRYVCDWLRSLGLH